MTLTFSHMLRCLRCVWFDRRGAIYRAQWWYDKQGAINRAPTGRLAYDSKSFVTNCFAFAMTY